MRTVQRLLAVVVLTAASSLLVPGLAPSPASAAVCDTSSGVTVIADFNQLGGGVQGSCVADGGGERASDLFDAAGLPLQYASRQPGFVCHVSGKPASDPCVNTAPADAYWGLWWSTGDAGSGWTYSTLGAGSLRIPDGGLVAFSWDQVPGDERPSASAARPAASSPPSQPSAGGGTGGSGGSGSTGDSGGSGGSPSGGSAPGGPGAPDTVPDQTGPTDKPGDPNDLPREGDGANAAGGGKGSGRGTSRGEKVTDSPSAEADPSAGPDPVVSDPTEPTSSQSTAAGSGLPVWVAPALIVVVVGAAGVLLWRRRRTGA